MTEEEKEILANELRRKSIKEDMLDKFLGDKPEFGSFQDATRSLIDSDYNPEGTVLSRVMGITKQPAQPNMNFNGEYEDRTQEFGVVPIVENQNIYRDKLNKLGMPEDSMSLLSSVDMLSDPIKSKNILVNRLKELPLDVLAKMLGVR
tara:strand:- start:53 stop:496 length:444 start_codon:yes stop_codon:yes gene_type:complete